MADLWPEIERQMEEYVRRFYLFQKTLLIVTVFPLVILFSSFALFSQIQTLFYFILLSLALEFFGVPAVIAYYFIFRPLRPFQCRHCGASTRIRRSSWFYTREDIDQTLATKHCVHCGHSVIPKEFRMPNA